MLDDRLIEDRGRAVNDHNVMRKATIRPTGHRQSIREGIVMRSNQLCILLWVIGLIIIPILFLGCDDEKNPQSIGEETWFLFGTRGDTTGSEDFIAITTDDRVIAMAHEQLSLPDTERPLHIHGKVTFGDGGHNLDWQWHFIPSEWQLVEVSAEVCDTSPHSVRDWLESMPDTITSITICPWQSYVKAEVR